jgi:hypothetical protein
MAVEAGIDKRIYYRATWGTDAAGWLEALNLQETGITRTPEMATRQNRQTKKVKKKQTFVEVGITFKVEVDEADTSYTALKTAAEAGTLICIGAGVSNASGKKLFALEAALEMSDEEHDNGTSVQRSFTAWPHWDGTHDGADITLTSGS